MYNIKERKLSARSETFAISIQANGALFWENTNKVCIFTRLRGFLHALATVVHNFIQNYEYTVTSNIPSQLYQPLFHDS